MFAASVPRRLAIALAALAVACCSRPASAAGELVYVGLFTAQTVNVYQGGSGYPLLGQLFDGVGNPVGGLAVDRFQKLYISTDGSWVNVFDRGSLVPSGTYTIGSATFPLGIAIGRDETLYAPLNQIGVLDVFAKGERRAPTLIIPMPQGDTPLAAAVDGQNNLYIEYGPFGHFPQPAHIEKCLPGTTQCSDLGITLGAGGLDLAFDASGDIVACDELAGQIDVFPPGATQPSRTLTQGLHGCDSFAFDKQRARLFVDDEAFGASGGGVVVFNYSTGAAIATITAGIPSTDFIEGIAVSPSAP
jgi:DNA-binding beta-propeller fold protein YncE